MEQDTKHPTKSFATDCENDEEAHYLEKEMAHLLKNNAVDAQILCTGKLLEITVAEKDLQHPMKISSNRSGTVESYLKSCGMMEKLGEIGPMSEQHRIRTYSQTFTSPTEAARAQGALKNAFKPIEDNGTIEKKPVITITGSKMKVVISDTAAAYKIPFNTQYIRTHEYLLRQGFGLNPGYSEYAKWAQKNLNEPYREIQLVKLCESPSAAKTEKKNIEESCIDLKPDLKIVLRGNKLHIGMSKATANTKLQQYGTLELFLVNYHGMARSATKGINYVGEEKWNQR